MRGGGGERKRKRGGGEEGRGINRGFQSGGNRFREKDIDRVAT